MSLILRSVVGLFLMWFEAGLSEFGRWVIGLREVIFGCSLCISGVGWYFIILEAESEASWL